MIPDPDSFSREEQVQKSWPENNGMNDNEPGISSLDWKWDGNGNGETIA
jgi:hypothetical protein